ncbi:sulfite exporter TauE/SafE family protein [Emcibacter nanhaiensis]|uniref:Probable membrane transporter protein n=1 Tax=Emcibacter nanhaiensis TaxID=1505037 RepID=A0A501PAV0_9PROT|nr:sulfite exporter TauE/SafE family protein [Emcibacter nanhaiensis]TPD57519.1 sulfite exporter TauE/SafE family protein [Emcibacter nanhaiensis]
MVDSLWFFALAAPLVLMTGVSKGGFASGLGSITVPLMSLLIDPRQAAAIMLPILCIMDLLALWQFRKIWDTEALKSMIPGALLGIGIGTATFHLMNVDMMRLMVGVMALYFVLNFWYGKVRKRDLVAKPHNAAKGGFFGMLSGFTSFVAHAGGPPVALYLLPLKLDKTLLVGTSVVFFTVVNYTKLIPYTWLGQLTLGNLTTSLILLPLAPLGIWLGGWLHYHASDRMFYIFFYGVLFVVGLRLTAEGLMALL